MPVIEGYERICTPVNSRFQHDLVSRVPQLWSPQEPGLNRLDQLNEVVQKDIDTRRRQSSSQNMFGPCCHRFIFNEQWHRNQQFNKAIIGSQQQRGRSACWTP